jgi:hypothetical protein
MLPLPHALPAMPQPTSLHPAVPGPRPSALRTGHRELPMLEPGPPGRLCLHIACMMCLFLSGQLSCAIRLLQLSVGLAVALHLLSVSFSVARVICCSSTPRCRGCALVVRCTVRTVCAKVALRVRVCRCLRFAFGRPSTPHHIHSSHTTSTHNHLHPSHHHRLALAHASLRWHIKSVTPIKKTGHFRDGVFS